MASIEREIKRNLPAFFKSTGLKIFSNDSAYVSAKGTAAVTGDAYFNTTTGFVRIYDGSGWRNVITEDANGDTSITADLVVNGDLTVQGTTTTINTTTMDVEDANITINKGGNQASADDVAGITVELSDDTDASILYDNEATSRWKIGDAGSEIEVTTLSHEQTLSNKSFSDEVYFLETTSPSSVPADQLAFYAIDQQGITTIEMKDSRGITFTVNEDLFLTARNVTGAQIDKGSVVYISGTTGAIPQVSLAQANALTTASILGVAKEDIPNNSYGRILTEGLLKSFNTSSFSGGDTVYLSASTPGALTTTRPSAPNVAVKVGTIISSGTGNGRLAVNAKSFENTADGTLENSFSIGDGTAGAKTLTFNNDNSGTLSWNPDAAYTLTLPNITDTISTRTASETLSNKTLAATQMSGNLDLNNNRLIIGSTDDDTYLESTIEDHLDWVTDGNKIMTLNTSGLILENAKYLRSKTTGGADTQVIGVTASNDVRVGDVTGNGLVTNIQANGTTVMSAQVNGNANFNSGNIRVNADNNKLELGAGQDAGIWYDGTDMQIDTQQVGTGKLTVSGGKVNAVSGYEVNGVALENVTETLTNKSIGGELVFNNQAEVRFAEQTGNGTNYVGFEAPDAVTSNQIWKLPDGDGLTNQALITDGAGNLDWGDAGGGGGGATNYISTTSSKFEGGTGDWAVYDDGGAFVDGTGGSPTGLSITQITAASNILEGDASLSIDKAASDASGEGVSVLSETIDLDQRGKRQFLKFSIDTTSAGYTSEDFKVRAFGIDTSNGANDKIIPVIPVSGAIEDSNGLAAIPQGNILNVVCEVLPDTEHDEIRVALHLPTDNNTAGTFSLVLDRVILTPDSVIPGAIIEPWTEFTPTGSWTTNTTYRGRKRRVGDTMEVHTIVDLSGVPDATPLTLDIPDSRSIDTTRLPDGGSREDLGSGHFFDFSASNPYSQIDVIYDSPTSVAIHTIQDAAAENNNFVPQTESAPFAVGSGDKISIRYSVPIDSWDASGTISTTENLFQNAEVIASNNSGQTITANTENIIFSTDESDEQGLWSGTVFTAPAPGRYRVMGNIRVSSSTTANLKLYKNGNQLKQAGRLDSTVSAHFGGTVLLEKGDELTLRTDVGFTLSSSAVEHWISIIAEKDTSVFGVSGETDLIEASSSPVAYPITASTWGDLTSVDLPPGEWDIKAQATWVASGGSVASGNNGYIGVSNVAGNNSPGDDGVDRVSTIINSTNGDRTSLFFEKNGVVTTETETYYLKSFHETDTTDVNIGYKISARKVK